MQERDEAILTLQARVAELESERNFLKKSNTPENHSKLIEDLKIDLDEAKETLNLQNDDMRNMQQKLQDKDDEIDKLREALEEDEQSNEQVIILQNEYLIKFFFIIWVRKITAVPLI